MTLNIHIGLHKTATSSLQEFLRNNAEALAAEGYVLPKTGLAHGGHHNVAYELLGRARFKPEHGSLRDCLDEAYAAPHAIISSEEFEFLDFAQVRRFKQAIGERPARIIVYLRRQDVLVASTYVQQSRMGAAMPSFETYLRACLYHPRFDFPQLLLRWASAFGRDNLEVSVIAPETSGPLLFDDFIDRVGLTARHSALTPLRRIANPTPGRAHLEIVRRIFAAMPSGQRTPVPKLHRISVVVEARIAEMPGLQDSGRLELDPGQWARVAQRFDAGNRWAAREFISAPALARALEFDAQPSGQAPELDEALIDAAVQEVITRLDLMAVAAPDPADTGPAA